MSDKIITWRCDSCHNPCFFASHSGDDTEPKCCPLDADTDVSWVLVEHDILLHQKEWYNNGKDMP